MVNFNELALSEDKNSLKFSFTVSDPSGQGSPYIKTIDLYTYKNLSSSGLPADDTKVYNVYTRSSSDLTEYSAELSADTVASELSISTFEDGLFFLHIELGDDSYEWDESELNVIGIVVDWAMLHERGMQYISGAALDGLAFCGAPQGFEHFIVLWFALKLAIQTNDYTQLKLIWEKYLRSFGFGSAVSSGCPCS